MVAGAAALASSGSSARGSSAGSAAACTMAQSCALGPSTGPPAASGCRPTAPRGAARASSPALRHSGRCSPAPPRDLVALAAPRGAACPSP
eukprot:1475660-Pyramimonas_sp.AAC.1